ncbi:MAG: hypothetical protein A2170_14220 [Deltaproteobacteria bacterium RBG_13_53_10]|nr:MAG: hypothetical protein A2170_14220 [Deltaproteobacteria bacterium RBG_13_53_10]
MHRILLHYAWNEGCRIRPDSGPFDKPFETLRVPREIEGLRVPSLSRDFRRNDEQQQRLT